MKVSVSRSVGRAFAVMEIFRKLRRPATATEISRTLNAPHSSTVAVLYNLCELGYLGHETESQLFFPTAKLLELASWLRPGLREHGRLAWLVDQIERDTGHMTVLTSRVSLFTNTLAMRPGTFPTVTAPARAVGSALVQSATGLAILSQLPEPDIADILRDTESWLKEAGARRGIDALQLQQQLEALRRRGHIILPHPTCRVTEILAYPVCATQGGAPFALSLHIPTHLSRDGRQDMQHAVAARLRDYLAAQSAPQPAITPHPAAWQPPRAAAARLVMTR